MVKQLGVLLPKYGHTVEVASLDPPDAPYLQDLPAPAYALGCRGGKYGYSPYWTPWLRENARRYDIVLVNGIWSYHSFGTWRALRSGKTPYAVFTHGMLDPWFKRRYRLKHLKKWLYWPWAEYRVLRDAGSVLFTCEEERQLARKSFWFYKCSEAVVGLGISSPDGKPDEQRRTFFDRFPQLRGKRVALFLSRIHPKKGCDLLIDAFAHVLGGNPDWHLVLAGPDQIGWKEALDKRATALGIGDQITWAGMLSGAEKWGAFHAADVFVLPSHSENFGIVVAEALACGVPVLISDRVNIWREVVADGAGIVFPDTLAGTENLLTSWSQMPTAQQQQMRRQAKSCFDTRFEVTRTIFTLMDVLGRIVANRSVANAL